MAVEVFKLFGSIFVNNEEANKSISKTDEKASGVASTLGKGVATAAKWSAAIVGGATAAAGGMMKMAQSTASTADNVDKMSQKIGISRQAYQELDFICSQSGTSVDKLQNGMKTLRNAMTGDKNAETFKQLGVSLTDASGKMKSSEQVMWDTMSALQGVTDADQKAVIAQQLFGKSGQELMPLLNGSAGSIDEMKAKAHELGLVMSDEMIDSGVGLTDSLDQIKRAFGGVMNQLGGAFMPVVKQVADKLQDFLPYIQQAISQLTPVLTRMFEKIVPVLFELGETLIPILFDAFEQLLPTFEQIITTVLPVILDIIQQLAPLFSQFCTEILPLIVDFLSQVGPVISDFISQVLPLAVSLISQILPFLVQITREVLPLVASFLQQFLPIVTQIITSIAPVAINILSQLLPPSLQICQAVLPTILTLFNSIMPLLKMVTDTILPILTNLLQGLSPILSLLAELFGGVLGEAIKNITTLLQPFFDILNNLISFIENIFKGNWEDAWNSIVEVFKGIINLIPSAIEGVINGAIWIINKMIDGINAIAGWLGVDIDHIPDVELPRLRQGIDFVPADNYPVALDYGEAVLTASEAEEYRKSKRENGKAAAFNSSPKSDGEKTKTVNQTFNISVTVEKIDGDYDVDDFVEHLSEQLALEVQRAENVYA